MPKMPAGCCAFHKPSRDEAIMQQTDYHTYHENKTQTEAWSQAIAEVAAEYWG